VSAGFAVHTVCQRCSGLLQVSTPHEVQVAASHMTTGGILIKALGAAFRTPDLRRKLLFTMFIMAIYRLGTFIPAPFVSMKNVHECMAQQEHIVDKILKSYPQVDLVFGTHNINRLPLLLKDALLNKERVVEVFSNKSEIHENLPVVRSNNLKAWVNIMYGCDKFCTYCIVPYTRGKERSRLKEDILKEVKELKEKGFKEITLLGQNVNAYGNDLNKGYNFADLLAEVSDIGIERIRFVTSHPWNFTEQMVDVIASRENIMPYIHLPIQSGDDDVLRRMGRRYTYEEYKKLYDSLRSKVKGCSITTDIIVGFPGETDEQFDNTLKAVTELEYDSAFTFIYSPRVGTPAAKMVDNVSEEDKKKRFNALVEVVGESAKKRNDAYVGKTLKVLVEGYSKKNKNILSGYSEENKLVNFKGKEDMIGKVVNVKITTSKTWTLEGEAL
jgi:tRNA-2-methylthio-N6-dimethylallyladenosine synthase